MPLVIKRYQKSAPMSAKRALKLFARGVAFKGFKPMFVKEGTKIERIPGTPVIFFSIGASIWNHADSKLVPYIEFTNHLESGKYACITRPYLDRVREKYSKVIKLLSAECARQLAPKPEAVAVEPEAPVGS